MTSSKQPSKQEKIALLEMMDERDRRRRANPLKYLERHAKQIEAHESDKAIRSLFWGNRVGKTEFGGMEAAEYAVAQHALRVLKPPYEIWVTCPSFEVQEYTTQKKLLDYLPSGEIERIDYLRGRIIRKITMKNGVQIQFKSYEQGREKFQGAGVRLIWFDEEPPKDIWEECFVRVEAGQQLDVILTMTAVKGMTWVYNDIYLATGREDLFVSEAGWDDNPWLTEEQKLQMGRGLSPQALQVRRDGKFVKRVGLVANWWDRSKHVRHYDSLPRDWTYYEVLDGGFSDPASYLLIGVDGDDNVHVVGGFRRKQLQAKAIKDIRDAKKSTLTITAGWTDNDNPRLQLDLAELGMYLTPVVKIKGENTASWDEALAEKMAEYGTIQKGTGEPRLYISDNLIEMNEETGHEENFFVQEIENLVWLERGGKQGEEIVPHWDDHRRFGHHFDTMRAIAYFLISYKKPIEDEYTPPPVNPINLSVSN